MSPPGRPKGSYRSAQHEGTPVSTRTLACGARAHHDAHSPGQQPGLAALIEWQSLAGAAQAGRLAGRPDAAPDLQALPAAAGAVRRLSAVELAWQPCASPDWPLALGRLQLWDALPDSVEWIDLTLSVHRAGRWMSLPVELVPDDGADADRGADIGGTGSDWLLLDDACDAAEHAEPSGSALAAVGLSLAALRAAAASANSFCCMLRLDGLGAFLACAIDLGWPD